MPTPIQIRPSPDGVPGAVTDPTMLIAEELQFSGAEDAQINGYLVGPAAPGSFPGMVVIHEAGGLNEHIRDVCARLARIGHVALAIDLYTREGGPPQMDDFQKVMERLFSIPDARALGDLQGAADLLRAREDSTGRVGCIGFCVGGRYTLLLACCSNRLDAAVDCWGGFIDRATLDERTTPARPTPPLEIADRLSCPLMVAIGAEDQNPSPQLGEQLRQRAASSGQEVQVDVYESAGHAFFADYRPTYRAQAAQRLWERIVPFLAERLGGV